METEETQGEFYGALMTGWGDESGQGPPLWMTTPNIVMDDQTALVWSACPPYTNQEKEKRWLFSSLFFAGALLVCSGLMTFICSECADGNLDGRVTWLCNTWKGEMCFPTQMSQCNLSRLL